MADIITAFTTASGSIATNMSDLISGIVPAALPVLGFIIAVRMGIRVIKQVTNG